MKKVIIARITLVICAISLHLTAWSQAGIVAVSESKDLQSSKTSTSKMYFTADKMMYEGAENSVVFDATSESFISIDHKKKETMVITKEDMEELQKQLNQMMAQMEEQLKNLPEAQQEMMRKNMPGMLSQSAAPEVDFKLVNSGVAVQSWSADQYDHLVDGQKTNEFYIADYGQLGVAKSDFAVMEKMAAFCLSRQV